MVSPIDPLLLDLPSRLITCLDRHDLYGLHDVASLERPELEKLKGIGSVSLETLLDHLRTYNVEPGDPPPEAPLYPDPLNTFLDRLSDHRTRWWTAPGTRMFRRFTTDSTSLKQDTATCVMHTGATRVTVELDGTEGRVTCSCGRSSCSPHGLAAVLFLARERRVDALFDGTDPDPSEPEHVLFDPLFFLLNGNTRNRLVEDDVRWTEELAMRSSAELTQVPGIGPSRAEEIETFLNTLNLRPGDRPESAEAPPAERLSPPLASYVFSLKNKTLKPDRGLRQFRNDAVLRLEREEDDTLRAVVRGNDEYRLTLDAADQTSSCSCDRRADRAPCEHALAAALTAARRERQATMTGDHEEWVGEDLIWLMDRVADTPADDRSDPVTDTCSFCIFRSGDVWRVHVSLTPIDPDDPEPVLRQRGTSSVHPSDVAHPADRSLLRRLSLREQGDVNAAVSDPELPGDLLPLLADRTIFVEHPAGTVREGTVHRADATPLLELGRTGDDAFVLHPHLIGPDRTVAAEEIELVSADPVWLLHENRFFRVKNIDLVADLFDRETDDPLTFTEDELSVFSERIVPELMDAGVSVRMRDDLFEEAPLDPRPRVYLRDRPNRLVVDLRIAYGDMEFSRISAGRFPVTDPDADRVLGVRRDTERERELLARLRDTGLRSVAEQNALRLEPEDDRGLWLVEGLPELTRHGFEVFGERDLDHRPTAVSPDGSDAHVRGGMDWFELGGTLEFGDDGVTFAELLEAVRDDRRYVRLSDERYGEIPEEWLRRLGRIDGEARVDGETVRVPGLSMRELDRWLKEMDEVRSDRTVENLRNFFRAFDGLDEARESSAFRGTLRDYQRAGLAWLQFLREYGFGGLLADDMGLGKTVQVLAHLQLVEERTDGFPNTLVVAPRSVLSNWAREAERFLPAPDVYRHHGTDRCSTAEHWPDRHLALTTYGTMRRDVGWLKEIEFDTVVLDECQAIRNPDTKTAKSVRLLQADHRLGLSGTPVQNTVLDLWSQFEFLNPGLLGPRSYFERRIAAPIENRRENDATGALRDRLHPFLLRRTKAQVADELPDVGRSVVDCPMEPEQRKVYESVRKRFRREVSETIMKEGVDRSRFKVLEGLTQLRQICCHPGLVDGTAAESSSKLDRFADLASDVIGEGHRALVFSQFVGFLEKIRKVVRERGWDHAYLDGSTRNRQEQVRQFQNDGDLPLFLISLQAGGEGLNLTAADYVFLMDPWWNPAVEQQAMDRTHRIGQDQPVFVYRMICPDTIEEKILEMQEQKKSMAENVVTPDAGVFKDLDRDDMMNLFD